MSATGTAVRAVWIIAFAVIALAFVDRMKPATPRRPIVVRVDNKPAPLYREPSPDQRWRSFGKLTAGSVLLGTLLACVLGFMFAIALQLVGGLLRA